MTVTVYHNPKCSTSTKVVGMLREAGLAPTVVEYLKTGWTRDQLQDLLKRMGAKAHDILRVRGTEAETLGLTDPAASDAALIAAMILDPKLVNRPIVATPKGAALCRPSEIVLTLI